MSALASSAKTRSAAALGVLVIAGAAVTGALAATGALSTGRGVPPPPLSFESQGAATAMAGAFAGSSTDAIPATVLSDVASLVSGPTDGSDSLGQVEAAQGRALLSGLGPEQTTIYAFPTSSGGVCFDVPGLARGCKQAFPVDEPATIDADTLYPVSPSGPVSEIAGITTDQVTGVQVVVNGVAHSASFGNDAWYYRFPDSMTPASAVTKLLVTLKDGSVVSVPTGFLDPPSNSG